MFLEQKHVAFFRPPDIDDGRKRLVIHLDGVQCVGVSAGASTPEFLIEQVIDRLKTLHGSEVEVNSLEEVDEGMTFKLPQELRD